MTRGRLALMGLLVVLTGAVTWMTWPRADAEIRILPDGTARLRDADGERPLPDTVVITKRGWRLGDRRRITVVNTDDRDHTLAMLRVTAGERRAYDVPTGRFGGQCTAHPAAGALVLDIR